LRTHVANSRFSARSGGDRIVKVRATEKVDLAIALAMAVGCRTDLERSAWLHREPEVEYELVSIHEVVEFEPVELGWDDTTTLLGYSFELDEISLEPPDTWEY
jgi:hypothetical protein